MASIKEMLNILSSGSINIDSLRKKYIKELSDYTGRITIAYYSGFLERYGKPNIDINDADMTGFMESLRGVDCSKGLDLILHTPGGNATAAESIVNYLRGKFKNDIRIIVPHISMSAGTMIACAGKEIVMGRHSSLGPIDPQLNGIAAYDIKKEYEEAQKQLIDKPESMAYWQIQLNKYPVAFIYMAQSAIDLSEALVKEWLGTCMYDAKKDKTIINGIVSRLNEKEKSKTHGRHFDIDFCKKIGLKIVSLEDDQELQEKVLSIHHAFTLTFGMCPNAVKIIENNEDGTMVYNSVN